MTYSIVMLAVILFLAVRADARRLARLRAAQEARAKALDRLSARWVNEGPVGPFPTARRVRLGRFSEN